MGNRAGSFVLIVLTAHFYPKLLGWAGAYHALIFRLLILPACRVSGELIVSRRLEPVRLPSLVANVTKWQINGRRDRAKAFHSYYLNLDNTSIQMARPATGREFVETAKERIASAKTVDALRAAQALLLPLEFGLSLEQTAIVIGLSKSRTGKFRTRFQRIEIGAEQVKTKKGLRNHARMSLDEEVTFLASFVSEAKDTGVLPIPS